MYGENVYLTLFPPELYNNIIIGPLWSKACGFFFFFQTFLRPQWVARTYFDFSKLFTSRVSEANKKWFASKTRQHLTLAPLILICFCSKVQNRKKSRDYIIIIIDPRWIIFNQSQRLMRLIVMVGLLLSWYNIIIIILKKKNLLPFYFTHE